MDNPCSNQPDGINKEVLIDFFRQIINDDWGYDDVMTASPDSVLTEYLNPHWNKDYILPRFLQSHVFMESICSKLDKHAIRVEKYEVDAKDLESAQLYDTFIRYFNPDVIYSNFNGYEENGPNLLVLRRSALDDDQKIVMMKRAGSWLDLVYGLEKEKIDFSAWGFSNALESLIAKIDPGVERDFLCKGRVMGFASRESEEYPEVGTSGMVVDGYGNKPFSNGQLLPLTNASDPARFGHLVGQEVTFHFLDIIRAMIPFPYGELISVSTNLQK